MNLLQNRNRLKDLENKLKVTKGKGGQGISWAIGIGIHTITYINR